MYNTMLQHVSIDMKYETNDSARKSSVNCIQARGYLIRTLWKHNGLFTCNPREIHQAAMTGGQEIQE